MKFSSDSQRRAIFVNMFSKAGNRFTLKYDPSRNVVYSDEIPNVVMKAKGLANVEDNLRIFDDEDDRYFSGVDELILVDEPLDMKYNDDGVLYTDGMYERNPNRIKVNINHGKKDIPRHEIGHHIQEEAFTEDELLLKSNDIEPRYRKEDIKDALDLNARVGSILDDAKKNPRLFIFFPETFEEIKKLNSQYVDLVNKLKKTAKIRELKEGFADEFDSGIEPASEDVEYAMALKEVSNPSMYKLEAMVK